MFRKLFVSATLGLGLLIPLMSSPKAEAHSGYQRCRHYQVFYRACDCDQWCLYASYSTYSQACRGAENLRCQGYQTAIE